MQQVIRNIKDVYNVASKFGIKCGVKRIDEPHGKGFLGVKMILGQKVNPNHDPLKGTKEYVPDIRNLWIAPGTTHEELIRDYLIGIKESIEKKVPVVDNKITSLSKASETSDEEIAAKIASGESFGVDGHDKDDDIEEIGMDGEEIVEEEDDDSDDQSENSDEVYSAPTKREEEKTENKHGDIMELLQQVVDNQSTIAEDLSKLDEKFGNLETRVDGMDKISISKSDKKVDKKKK